MGLSAARTNFANKTPLVTKIGRKALANQTFYNGALCALDGATRFLKPNTGAAGDLIVGCADLKNHPSVVSPAANGGAIIGVGWLGIEVITGIFPFAIGTAGDALVKADEGNYVYGIDDWTVGKTDGGTGRPRAGRLIELETLTGVALAWVAIGLDFPPSNAVGGVPGSVDSVAASGAVGPSTSITELTVAGTKAYTIGAPLFAGQEKLITTIAASATPVATLTSAGNTNGWTTISGLGAIGACIRLVGNASLKWDIAGGLLVTVA